MALLTERKNIWHSEKYVYPQRPKIVATILIPRKRKRTYPLNKKNQICESTQPLQKFLPDLNQLIWYKKEDGKVDYFA